MAYPTRYKWLPGRRYLFVDLLLYVLLSLSTTLLLLIVWLAMTGGN